MDNQELSTFKELTANVEEYITKTNNSIPPTVSDSSQIKGNNATEIVRPTTAFEENQVNDIMLLNNCLDNSISSHELPATALMNVFDENRQPRPCRALLDSDSQSIFITKHLENQLNLPQERTNINVSGVTSVIEAVTYKISVIIGSK